MPAETVSAIMLEAWKKYVLTSLLQYGRVVDVPKVCAFVLRESV